MSAYQWNNAKTQEIYLPLAWSMYRFEKKTLLVPCQPTQDHLTADQLMVALSVRDEQVRMGFTKPKWWLCLNPKHYNTCSVDMIRSYLNHVPHVIPPERSKQEKENVTVFRNQQAFCGVDLPDYITLSYRHWKRADLEHIVREKDLWTARYPGAVCLHLAYQYIEMCISKLEGIETSDFQPFVNKLCTMLEMPRLHQADDIRSKITSQGLQLMHRFLTFYAPKAEEVDDVALRNQIGMNGIYMFTPEDDIQPLFDFKETLFSLLTSISLECDTLLVVWNLLQVTCPRRQYIRAANVTFSIVTALTGTTSDETRI